MTLGPQVGEVARRLGMPFMPWQQHVIDVALELGDDGGLFYGEVDLSTPRQNGKTAIVLSKKVHRANALAAFGGPQRILYTAQDRNNARKKWLDDHVKRLRRAERSFKEGRDYTIRLSNGSEAILWANGSSDGICAPTDTAAHGDTLDEGVIDEAFAHVDDAVEQGMSPAMITRRNKQFFVLSTAGHAQSFYFWRKVLAGRRMIDTGAETPVAYFEWGAPIDADPMDPRTWALANPALGITITEAALGVELARLLQRGGEGGLRQFRRAHLNQWVDEPILEENLPRVFGPGVWEAVCASNVAQPAAGLVFSVAVTPDRTVSAIGVAGGGGTCSLVERRSGVGWAVDEVIRVAKQHNARVAVQATGPAGVLISDIERGGASVVPVSPADMRSACGWFFDRVVERKILVKRHPDLDDAVSSAVKRTSGDSWVWDRRAGDISALEAVTLAAFVAGQAGERPQILF